MILDWFCICVCVCLVFNDFIQSDDKFSALTNSWVDLHNRQVSIERSRVYTEAYDVCLWMLCSRALHTQNSLSCDCFLAVHPSNWLVFVGQGFYSLFLISLSLFRFSFSFSLFLVFFFLLSYLSIRFFFFSSTWGGKTGLELFLSSSIDDCTPRVTGLLLFFSNNSPTI